jgi:integrase
MGYVEKHFGKSPQDFTRMSPKQAGSFILDMISSMESEKKSGSYISNCVKAVRNWLDFNGIQIPQKIKISNRDELTKFADERPPTPDELKRIFNASNPREKAACAIIAFSGVRLEVLGNYLGDDGLKLKDFPELTINGQNLEFVKVPTLVIVRKPLSKIRKQYTTFLCEEGCDYLKAYLNSRLGLGEKLTPESPIITPSKSAFSGDHIRTTNIGDLIRKAIRAAGFQWRPYVLRRYFDIRLMMAESDGFIIRDYRTFWMGHQGDIENTYTVNKGLSEDVIQKMRESYERAAAKYLQTLKAEIGTDKINKAIKEQLLAVAGYSEEETSKLNPNMTDQEIYNLVKQRLVGVMSNNGSRQKVITLGEVECYVAQGWEYVTAIPNDRAIMKVPF